MNIETCFICDEPTGRAGKGDDSIYAENGDGPFCVACWKKLQSNKQPDPTTPTVPGWYMYRMKGHGFKGEMTKISEHDFEDRKFVRDDGFDGFIHNYDFIGPIPLPEGWGK